MKTFLEIFNIVTQHILGLTLYDVMRASSDFNDVRLALNARTEWSIELVGTSSLVVLTCLTVVWIIVLQFRSCFTIHISHGSQFFTLSALSFLIIAESIHIYYGRLSPAELKEHAEGMGYATFAILFAVLDIGFVIVRVAGLFALSNTPGLAMGLVLTSMLPSITLPLLAYVAKLVRRGKQGSDGGDELESGIVLDEI